MAGVAVAFAAGPASAQQAIFAPGEPIVTGFSGVLQPATPPPEADPLDYTLIDPDGNSMVIQQLQPDGPPQGQLIPSPPVFTAKAKDVGQVFGVTLDNAPDVTGAAAPNIYLSATSAYGLDIVVPGTDGSLVRGKTGEAGAEFMPGLWGGAGGAVGSPGSIWKVDGVTGQISLFSTIAANRGPGLGDIVFDASTQQFFVSDLDTGLIYRLAADGTIIDTFDHGTTGRPAHGLAAVPDDGSAMDVTSASFNSEDPTTWGFTQPERRVYGMAVHGGRLYYAVADGPQIWSVGITLDGGFANDARWELDVTGLPSKDEVANIVFDPEGRMILAQRSQVVGSYDYTVFADTKTSSVVRYTREVPDDPATPSTWVETPDSYAIGFRPDGNNAAGGIALGYGWDPKNQDVGGVCSTYLWSTGDSLRDDPSMNPPLSPPAQVHGLQGNDRTLVRPANDPPTNSYFTDYDGNTGDDQAQYQGHVGAVDIWQKCQGGYGYITPWFPPPGYVPPPDGNLTLIKRARPQTCYDAGSSWLCSYTIRVQNTGPSTYWGPLTVDDWLPDNNPGAQMFFAPQPPWSCSQIGSTEYQCGYPPVVLYPGDAVDLYDTVKLPKQGNTWCELTNAAAIEWLYGFRDANPGDDYDFATARIPDPQCRPPQGPKTNLKLTKVAHPEVCVQDSTGFACSFYIRVSNTGPGDYNAPLQVKDTLPFAMPTSSGPPPWTCATAGPTLTCDYPTVLLHPGDSRTLKVTTHVPAAAVREGQVCKIDNTAQITKAPGGTDLNTSPGDDKDSATALIPTDQCNPTRDRTDLSLTKTALGCRVTDDGPRTLATPAGAVCAFEIRIKNEGPANFNGPVTVHDAFAPAIPLANFLAAPPICGPSGGGYDCTTPVLSLAPGQTYPFFVSFRLPANSEVCDVKNVARITSPAGGSVLNFNPANDAGSAAVHIPGSNCDPDRQRSDLSLTKTHARCQVEELIRAGYAIACFDVTVTNNGPGPYTGPIQFQDQPSVAGANLSGGSDATCSPAGGGFNCAANANVSLNAGDSVTYNVALGYATQDGKVCRITNRARLTMPAAPSLHNTNPANDVGQDTAVSTAPECSPAQLAPAQLCSLEQQMPNGKCCDEGLVWNGKQCAPPRGHKPPPVITTQCPPDSFAKGGVCLCDPGTHGDPGYCRPNGNGPNCPPDSRVVNGECLCDPGTHGDPGYCQPNGPNCPRDSQVVRGICMCDPGTHGDPGHCQPNGQSCPQDSHAVGTTCVCDRGTHGDPGFCKPDSTGPVCPKDSHAQGDSCTCNQGTHGRPGRCVPDIVINPVPLCPSDSHWNSDRKVCQCNPPLRGKPGACAAPDTGNNGNNGGNNGNGGVVPPQCPADSHWNVRSRSCVCNPPTHGTPGNCQAPSDNGGKPAGNGGVIKLPQGGLTSIVPECPSDSHWNARAKSCVCNPPKVGKPGACEAPGNPVLKINPGILKLQPLDAAPQGEVIR